MNGGFLSGNATTIHQALNKGVIRRDLLENALAQPVNAGIADVGNDHSGFHPNHRANRGPHAGEFRVLHHGVCEIGAGV